MNEKFDVQLSFMVPKSLNAAIAAFASRRLMNKSDIIRTAVLEYLQEKDPSLSEQVVKSFR